MAATTLIALNIDEYFDPLYGSPIIIPQNYVIYRGYDTRYSAVSNRPSHYSVKGVAEAYAENPHSALGCFTNTRALRLIDFRYMGTLLNLMFANCTDNTFASIDPIVRISVGYGLCDIREQIELGRRMFVGSVGMQKLIDYYDRNIKDKDFMNRPLGINTISQSGFRIAETKNDGYILNFVKEIFGDAVDGFIAPRLKSPYHYEKHDSTMSPEIVLFAPQSAGIQMVADDPNMPLQSINEVLNLRSSRQEFRCSGMTAKCRKSYGFGGGSGPLYEAERIDASDQFFQLVDDKDTEALKLIKQSTSAAKKWKKKFAYINYFTPHPCTHVSDWSGGNVPHATSS